MQVMPAVMWKLPCSTSLRAIRFLCCARNGMAQSVVKLSCFLQNHAGSYTLPLNRTPRTLADMEWDTVGRSTDIELSSNCLTATKTSSSGASTVRGTILYNDAGVHEFHVILDSLGPDGIWVGVANPDMDPSKCVGDVGCGWALHSDGDRRFNGREEEFTSKCSLSDHFGVHVSLAAGTHSLAKSEGWLELV